MSGKSFVKTTTFSFLLLGLTAALFFVGQPTEAEDLCAGCHDGENGSAFPVEHVSVGEPGSDIFLLVQAIMSDSGDSSFLDSIHVNNGVGCSDCHHQSFEMFADVSNETCCGCHGDYQELAGLTENDELEEMNPHKSHLGEIDCTVCHHAHQKSSSYCLQCHFEFQMEIPAG